MAKKYLSSVLIFGLLLAVNVQSVYCETSVNTPSFEYAFDIGGQPGFITIQDRDGFLWFSSFYNGLVRYDGSGKMMIREGEDRLSNDFVTQIFEDDEGLIWAGTNYGLNLYDKKTNKIKLFLRDPDKPESSLVGNTFNLSSNTIIQDRSGNMWFGTQSGLSRYNKKKKVFTNYQYDPENPYSLSDNNIFCVYEDSNGLIWVATKDKGLNSLDPETGRFTRYQHDSENQFSFPDNSPSSILQDKEGNFWIATQEHGLIRRDKDTGLFKQLKHDEDNPDSIPKMDLRHLILLSDGRIVLHGTASSVGLVIMNPADESFEQYLKEAGKLNTLSTNSVFGSFEDKDGTLWLIHNNGKVDKYDPGSRRFELFKHNALDNSSLASNVAVPVYEDRGGRIWIGHFGAGLDLFNPETRTFTNFVPEPGNPKTLPHGYPAGFYESSKGEFFISTAAGLVSFDPVKGEVLRRYTSDTWYYTIIEDLEDPDVIWAVGWEQSFHRLNLRTMERKVFRHDPDDPDSFSAVTSIRMIRDRKDQNIFWIATWGGGLEKFDLKTSLFTHHKNIPGKKDSISSNTVYDVMEDSRGNIWVSTDKGLNKFDRQKGTFKRFGREEGLDAKIIHNILEDNSGRLWMGTNIGLVAFDIDTETVLKIYTIEDGLHSLDFFPTARGTTRDGHLWFGGFNGLNRFIPEKLVENTKTPSIYLTSIKKNGIEWIPPTAFEYLKEINLDWRNNSFEFEYVALNYSGSSKNQYKYKLEGYDKEWYDGGTRRFGRYTGLPGGTYTLKIQGSNNDGYWSRPEQDVSLLVHVSSPPWARWWAFVLYVFTVLAVIYIIFIIRTRRLMKQSKMLQERVDERTLELARLNTEMRDTLDAQIIASEIARLAYFELDLKTMNFLFNDQMYKLLNTTAEQEGGYIMPAQYYSENFTAPEDIPVISEKIAKCSAATVEFADQFQYQVIRKDSSIQYAYASYRVLLDEQGRASKTFGIHMDITEQKLAEQALEKAKEEAEAATRAKSDFLANMSHEIRTPMNAIIGLDNLLMKTKLDDKQFDYTHKINSASINLLGIINDILDFSKIEAGKLDIEIIPFNLNSIMATLSDMIGDKASSKGVELIFNQDTDIPNNLLGDPLRLGQILLNLSNNAVKFTEKGEIEVSSNLVRREDDKVLLQFEVRDTGIGLSEEHMGKLFKSFSQADSSTTRKYGGTGLGLTISKHLSELMGGEIGVKSRLGEGSTFFFTVQLGLGEEKEQPAAPEELKGLKVLVVDDNETSREVLRTYLDEMDFLVTSVPSGELALREIIKSRADGSRIYDLVLMDYQMPGMNGIEASRKIQSELENVDVPQIVMVTSYGREEIMRKADNAGLQGFLVKPVSPSMLLDTIMNVFGKSSGLSALDYRHDKKPDGFDSIRGARLLLIEDNEINQQVARETLEQEGFFVDIAENGLIGAEKALGKSYDMVLMDLQMPVMGGYESTEIIRKEHSKEELAIIAMTADAMTGVRDKVLEVGMNDYITKPINTTELWKTLIKWIIPKDRPLPDYYSVEKDMSIEYQKELLIPGLDTVSGLQRVGNNRGLYEKLLKRFASDYIDFSSYIYSLMENDKHEEAVRAAHTIKGVSANIGGEELQKESAVLESELKEEGDWQSALNSIIPVLNEIIDGISRNLSPDRSENSEDGKFVSSEVFKENLQTMIESLEKRKPIPVLKILESLSGMELAEGIKNDLNNCRDFLNNYRMKDAKKILEEILISIK